MEALDNNNLECLKLQNKLNKSID